MDDHVAEVCRLVLAIAFGVILFLVGVWDGYAFFRHRNDLTVSATLHYWQDQARIITVLATMLFYHLCVER